MAAPHVTGALALLASCSFGLTPEPAPGGPARRGDDDAVPGRQDLDRADG